MRTLEDSAAKSGRSRGKADVLGTGEKQQNVRRKGQGEMDEKQKPLLTVKGLSVSFQEKRGFKKQWIQPIRDLSLQVYAGEITALAGASGSGKSLLAQAVLGILPEHAVWEGTIEWKGQELTEDRLRCLRGRELALIPQGVNGLDPLMTAGRQIRKGRKDREAFQRMEELLERYSLPIETAGCYPFELSGGMARRVLTAGATMERPGLVIADEPTPGLDTEAAVQVMEHFREMADQGVGVFVITHDLELALQTADRILIFFEGAVAEELQVEKNREGKLLGRLAAPPVHPYAKRLFDAVPGTGRPWKEEIRRNGHEA